MRRLVQFVLVFLDWEMSKGVVCLVLCGGVSSFIISNMV